MLLILPIDNQYHQKQNNADAILQLIIDFFPGGIGTLAYLCLILKGDLRDFVNDAIVMLLESYNQSEDESLSDYVYNQINDLCWSEEFSVWLAAFHTTHSALYSEYLGAVETSDSQQYKDHGTKLYIELPDVIFKNPQPT